MKNMMNKNMTIPEYLEAILAELKKMNKTEKKPKKNADTEPAKKGA